MNIFRIIGREHKKTLTLTLNALWQAVTAQSAELARQGVGAKNKNW